MAMVTRSLHLYANDASGTPIGEFTQNLPLGMTPRYARPMAYHPLHAASVTTRLPQMVSTLRAHNSRRAEPHQRRKGQ